MKRKYESSERPCTNDDEKTPKNQAIRLAGSPYDQSTSGDDTSTVRSRKAHKSKLTDNKLSPMRQPQAIIGEGIISNNHGDHEQMIGEGLAAELHFQDETDFQLASSCPLPGPAAASHEIVKGQAALSENDVTDGNEIGINGSNSDD